VNPIKKIEKNNDNRKSKPENDWWTKNGYLILTFIIISIITALFIVISYGEKEIEPLILITTYIVTLTFIYKLLKTMEATSFKRRQRKVKVITGKSKSDFEINLNEAFQSIADEKSSIIEVKEIDKFIVYIYYYPNE